MRHWIPKFLPAVVTALLVACSHDGGDGESAAKLPEPVTQQVSARDGGQLQMDGADGSRVTLDVAPGSFDADRPVMLRALPPAAGAPLRVEIVPAAGAFRVPPTLRIVPPPAAASGAPALRVPGGDWLATRVLPDGTLEARLRAAQAALQSVASARRQAQRAHAAELEPTSAYELAPFVATCERPNDALAAARAIFDHDTNPEHVIGALALVSNLSDICGGVPAAGEALATLRGHVESEYPVALAAWKAPDYRDLARLPDFRGGLTRVLAWCAAAQMLGLPIACPPADADVEFGEILAGFERALPATDDLAALQRQAGDLLQAAADAQRLGVAGQIDAQLLATAGQAGRRIVERAWALCSLPDMARWGGQLTTLPNAVPADEIEDAYLQCGTRVALRVRDETGAALPDLDIDLQPGDFDGHGAATGVRLYLPMDGRVAMRFTGPAMRCSRVIGAAEGHDEIVWRVGAVELGRRQHDGTRFDGPELEITLPNLRTALGRPADSRGFVDIEIWRVNATITCDVDGEPVRIAPRDDRLYNVQVVPPQLGVTVWPAEASAPMFGQVAFGAIVGGVDDPAVDWSASGGTVSASGVFTAPAVPGTHTVTATSRAQPAQQASATVTVAMPTSATLWLGAAGASGSANSGTSGQLSNTTQQRKLVSTETGQRSASWSFRLNSPVAATAAPEVDANGNLVFKWWSLVLPGAAATLDYHETAGSTTTTPCGPQYRDTVTLSRSESIVNGPLDVVNVGVTLRITPSGQATMSANVNGSGPARLTQAGRICQRDSWADYGWVVELVPFGPRTSSAGAGGQYAFDLLRPGTTTVATTLSGEPGTRTLTWNGLALRETIEHGREWHRVDPAFGTDMANATRTRIINDWIIQLN